MHISKIYIKNYRGIKEETLKFNKYNTLVWKNDWGKSTIINAVKLFFNDDKVTKKDFNFYLSEPENIIIKVVLWNVTENNLKPFLVSWEKEDGLEKIFWDYVSGWEMLIEKEWIFHETKEVPSKVYINVNSFEWYLIHEMKSPKLKSVWATLSALPPTDWSWDNSDLERRWCIHSKLLELWTNRISERLIKKHWDLKDFFPIIELLKADQSIETTTSDFKWTFTTEVKSIIKSEKESWRLSTLKDIEEKISTKIDEESKSIKKCMWEHISDLDELIITPSFSWEKWVETTDVKIKLKWDEQAIPLENKWSWYRRLFMVWRLRYLAEKKESTNVIYLIEEPETFLHPSAQEEMLESLIWLSNTNQIFITTHSPIFTWATQLDWLTLCKKESTKLKYEQRSDDDFLLDVAAQLWVKSTHNLLDTYESFLFLEWKDDIWFIESSYKKIFNKDFPNDKVCLMFGWWSTLKDFIRIRYFTLLKDKHNKKLFLLIDSDKWNNDSQKLLKNQTMVSNFNIKVADMWKAWLLNSRYIESYYHKNSLERVFNDKDFSDLEQVKFEEDFDVIKYLKWKWISEKNSKWNRKIFEEMTRDEWIAISWWELESIFIEII